MHALTRRWAVFATLASAAACTPPAATGAISVTVELKPALKATCVKVSATDGQHTLETAPMPLNGMSVLRVAVAPQGLGQTVTLTALGFTNADCTTSSGESSAAVEASFATPPTQVTLVLAPTTNGDGGFTPDGGNGTGDGGTDSGVDGGLDAGVDGDGDGSPLGTDCNDGDPSVFPGAQESCVDGKDNDCDLIIDCADSTCAGQACANGGTCTGGICMGLNEVCNDRVDNNDDQLVDCLDPMCANQLCNDGDFCTTGDTCGSDGGCQKSADVMCVMPPEPQCQLAVGTCVSDGGASCSYAAKSGACDDGQACTTPGTCTNGACVQGPAVVCGQAPVCRAAGACTEPMAMCVFAPLAAGQGVGTCSDNDPCTINDACDGDGGCEGARVTCVEPSQCHQKASCDADGGCLFSARTGQACDAGTGMAARCDSLFACSPALFPFVQSNFTDNQLPNDGGVALTISADATLNTDTPSLSPGTIPPFTIITVGGQSTLLLLTTALTVNASRTLTITGSRPAIFAVTGNVSIVGAIRANNAGAPSDCGVGSAGVLHTNGGGGGGGGGFGSVGGLGGAPSNPSAGGVINGTSALIPIRGGCAGGIGQGPRPGGAGGGAIQISSVGAITISGVLSAPGLGGAGNANNSNLGGGGGGSGGGILLEAGSITVGMTGIIAANGGGGGAGSDMGSAPPGNAGTESLTPASGGNGNYPGGNGAAGTTAATNGTNGGTFDGSGGGGGGVGRIRLNAVTGCTLTTGRIITPDATSNGAPNCP